MLNYTHPKNHDPIKWATEKVCQYFRKVSISHQKNKYFLKAASLTLFLAFTFNTEKDNREKRNKECQTMKLILNQRKTGKKKIMQTSK